MRCILTLLMSVVSLYVLADNEELYRSLDETIARAPDFVKKREQRIGVVKQRLQKATDEEERYRLVCSLFNEYMPYKSDSAAKYVSEAILIAEKRGSKSDLCLTRSLLAFLCSSTGQYVESRRILDSTDIAGVDREALGQYYKSLAHVYGEMAYYSNIPKLKYEFFAKQEEYTEKIYETLPPSNDYYLQQKEQECYKKGDVEGALHYSDKRLETARPDSHEFAIAAFYRSMDLRKAGETQEAMAWLAKSAVCDVRNAVMDQGSLWELANLLAQEGKLERARVYITFAWECANIYSTHVRSWQISPILSSIDRQYQKEIEHTNSMLTNMTIAVSILLLFLVVLLMYEYRRRRQLKEAHNELSEKNAQTKTLNDELLQANLALDDTILGR